MKIILDEHRLLSLIMESVKTAINELGDTNGGQYLLGAVYGRAKARPRYQFRKYWSPEDHFRQNNVARSAFNKAYYARENVPEEDRDEMEANAKRGFAYGYKKGQKQ